MTWLDTIIITIVAIGGLAILYKALKEPIDLVAAWIKGGIGWGASKVSPGEIQYDEVIRYG